MSGAIPLFPICLHGMHRRKFAFILDSKLARGTRNEQKIWFVNVKNPVFVQFTLSWACLFHRAIHTCCTACGKLSLCIPKSTHPNILGNGDRGPYVLNVWPDSLNLPTSGHTAWPVTLHSKIVYYLPVGKRCARIASTALSDLANA